MSVARTGGNLPNGNFTPEIWSMKLQVKFYAKTVLGAIANHDYEGEISNKGDKVHIRQRPDIVVGDYTVNGSINYQDLQDSKLELTIDHAKYMAWKIDDVDKKQNDIDAMNEATMDGAEAMKIHVDKHVLGAVYADAGSQTAITQVTKVNVLDFIVDLGTTLDELNVPESGRFLVLPPWVCGMIKKSDLKDASLSGDSTSIIRNGRVGIIDTFELYKSNLLDGLSTEATPLHVLAGTKHAITFASQFVKTETLRLQNSFGNAARSLKVYGFKVIKPEALIDVRVKK